MTMSSKFKKGDKIIINGNTHATVLKVYSDPSDPLCGMLEYKDENGFAEYAYEFQCELREA